MFVAGCYNGLLSSLSIFLRSIAAHVVADSLVVEHALDASESTDSKVLVPEFPLGKVHDVLLGDAVDDTLDFLWRQAAAGSDDLAAGVLSHSGGSIERKEDGCTQLGFGTLDFSRADVV